MKKNFIVCVIMLLVCAFGINLNAAEKKLPEKVEAQYEVDFAAIGHNILWYIPNCLMDLVDCFSIELSAGDIAADVDITKYASFGAGVGKSYAMGWTNKRQIGFFTDANYNADFLFFSTFERSRRNLLGTYEDQYKSNVSCADIINHPETMRFEDPYAIGAKVSFLLGAKFQFHPVEFADFICELFFFDLKGDSNKKKIINVIE